MARRNGLLAQGARGLRAFLCVLVASLALLLPGVAAADPGADRFSRMLDPYTGNISPAFEAWMAVNFERYKQKYIKHDGRVVDPENGSITHSEGMGYGMLLALAANDRKTFDLIWTFVVVYMQRDDDLISWVWDPYATPHVRDPNNATDGDILIAAALFAASQRWQAPKYFEAGARIAKVVSRELIVEYGGRYVLLPGKVGFATPRAQTWFWGASRLTVDRSPIINQSYWIYFALPALKVLAPDEPWDLIQAEGLNVLLGNVLMPTEWSELKKGEGTHPAPGRRPEFAYNAIRIPLYLLAAGMRIASFNEWLLAVWEDPDPGRPFSFSVPGYRRISNMTDPGYRIIHQLLSCVETDRKIDYNLFQFRPTTYFASSLHLLAFGAIYAYHPRCIPV